LEASLLDADHLAAVKLALKTKRLPVTEDDLAAMDDPQLSPKNATGSGFSRLPLADHYAPYRTSGGFPAETIRIAEFLVANRRAFKQLAENGFNDDHKVTSFARHCGDEQRLRALFVFTYADRFEWESEFIVPSRWFNIRELYLKAVQKLSPWSRQHQGLARGGLWRGRIRKSSMTSVTIFGGMSASTPPASAPNW